MKPLFLILIFLLNLHCVSQTIMEGNEKFVMFRLKHEATDTASVFGIHWKKENLVSEFTLNGKTPVKYALKLENDTVAYLSKYIKGKWAVQEKMEHSGWAISRIEGKAILSKFKIMDFNKDGNEDLVCWVNTNINGNEWTLLYLNDPVKEQLVKLWDTAENTDIWDRPEYDSETGIISTTQDGSAHGSSSESTFKLENLIAIPLTMHYQNRYDENITDEYYKGVNGKWELVERYVDRTINFQRPDSTIENINWKKEQLTEEFMLNGRKPLRCSIRLLNDWQAILSEKKSESFIAKDTLTWFEWPGNETLTQSFIITDFDRDGNEDLICWHLTNVNGNQWMTIYLNNAEKNTLELLKNPIADEEDVWAAPEYDHNTKIITCTTVSGAFGISDLSTYRLDRKTAIALEKKEEDHSDVSMDSGHVGIIRTYVGAGDHWKLLTETKLLPQDED